MFNLNNQVAVITGASSGIGREMAKYLSTLGYDLILVARDKEKLQAIQKELKTDVKIVVADLSDESKLKKINMKDGFRALYCIAKYKHKD